MERSTTVGALSQQQQLKSSRQPKILYELCPGYVDRNGIWNNGFDCPKWGPPNRNYCCGDAEERICCAEPNTAAKPTVSMADYNSAGSASQIRFPVVAGVVSGVLVILALVLLICCCFCRCCPGYKRRTRPKPSKNQDDSCKESTSLRPKTKTSMTTAAPLTPTSSDWTSVPTDWTTSDDEGGSRPFGLHCGCRWSPNHQTCSAAAAAGGDFRMQAIDVFDDFYDPCQSPVTATLTAAHHHLPHHHLHHHHHQHLQHHHNRMHCVECLPTVDAAPPAGFVRRCPVVV